jgi:hypothetical protein
MRSASVIVLIAVVIASGADDKIDVANGVKQAEAISKALFDGDYAKLADATHSNVVEIMGGKEKMIEQIKDEMEKLKGMGFKLELQNVGKPHDPVIDGTTAYMVVPTTLKIKTPDSTITSDSYLLGMTTDGGKVWVFVDGAGMANESIKDKVFPKLPAGLKLPERKPPVVSKDKD